MLIDFKTMDEVTIPNLNDGQGCVSAKMFGDPATKIMISKLPVGCSIGLHHHASSSEINYVISGTGKAICDGIEEQLSAGDCHYCPKGCSHSIINVGTDDLILFTVVPEQ